MKPNLLPLLIFCLTACQQLTDERKRYPVDPAEPVSVTLAVSCPDSRPASRAGDPALRDLNIYLFNAALPELNQHEYVTGTSALLSLMPGTYEIFVIGNRGADMGQQSAAGIRSLSYTASDIGELIRTGDAPLTAYRKITIDGPTDIQLPLIRSVAQLDLSLCVAPQVQGLQIKSVRLMNVPGSVALFADNRLTDAPPADGYEITGGTLYLPENKQGTVTTITDETERDKSRAPVWATYLLIVAEKEGRKIDYCVFLGGNKTTDFNVERNRRYNVTVTLSGTSTLDWRVSMLEVSVTPFPAVRPVGQTATASLTLDGANLQGNYYDLSYRFTEGGGMILIDRADLPEATPLRILSADGSKTVPIEFAAPTPGTTGVELTITDRYGYTMRQTLTTRFANFVYGDATANGSATSCTVSASNSVTLKADIREPAPYDLTVTLRWYGVYGNDVYKGYEFVTLTIPKGKPTAQATFAPEWGKYPVSSYYLSGLCVSGVTKNPADQNVYVFNNQQW